MSIILPTVPTPAETQDPRNLIIYGAPKIGKTTLLSTLPNLLICDLEQGSLYISGLKYRCSNVQEIAALCNAIKEAGKPYKYIAIDTVTALEDMVKPLALQIYKSSPMGSSFTGTDVLLAPHGAGYGCMRQALEKVLDLFKSAADNIIIVGHVKSTTIDDNGASQDIKDLDIAGKAKRVLAASSDAIGYVGREKNGDLYIDFSNGKGVEAGARPEHLRGAKIVVAERQEDGTFKSFWDRIYPSEVK